MAEIKKVASELKVGDQYRKSGDTSYLEVLAVEATVAKCRDEKVRAIRIRTPECQSDEFHLLFHNELVFVKS